MSLASSTRTVRLPQSLWDGLIKIADKQDVTLNTLVRRVLAEYADDNYVLATQRYECKGCGKRISMGDPVIAYKGDLFCSLDHAVVFITANMWSVIYDFNYGQFAGIIPAQPDLADTLRRRANQLQRDWLYTSRAKATPLVKHWDRAHPAVCKSCGGVFDYLNIGDVYGSSSYGSHHIGCLVPPPELVKELARAVVHDWLYGLNLELQRRQLTPLVHFDPATIESGWWSGTEVTQYA